MGKASGIKGHILYLPAGVGLEREQGKGNEEEY
jgi:hypothetical protein